jgi:hypothetical protein
VSVNLAATGDREVIPSLWAQTVTVPSTFSLNCSSVNSGTVLVDKTAIAAIALGTLH